MQRHTFGSGIAFRLYALVYGGESRMQCDESVDSFECDKKIENKTTTKNYKRETAISAKFLYLLFSFNQIFRTKNSINCIHTYIVLILSIICNASRLHNVLDVEDVCANTPSTYVVQRTPFGPSRVPQCGEMARARVHTSFHNIAEQTFTITDKIN